MLQKWILNTGKLSTYIPLCTRAAAREYRSLTSQSVSGLVSELGLSQHLYVPGFPHAPTIYPGIIDQFLKLSSLNSAMVMCARSLLPGRAYVFIVPSSLVRWPRLRGVFEAAPVLPGLPLQWTGQKGVATPARSAV